MPTVSRRLHQGPPAKTSPDRRRGLFITFEGIEGSGKSTQCRILAEYLEKGGYRVIETREPGGTPMAEHIRSLFLQTPTQPLDLPTPETEACLVFAARSQHVASRLLPSLSEGAIVLCDRFSDSTLAYQGYGRNLNVTDLQRFNRFVSQGLTPDMTFVFDLPVQQGLARRRRDPEQNRMDKEALAFHSRVRNGFLTIARQHPRRITIINARRSQKTISKQIWAIVEPVLQRRLKAGQISRSPGLKSAPRNKLLN